MGIRKELTLEEKRAKVAGFNVIDDAFFRVMMQDREVCEEMLRILLSDPKLEVVDHHPQESLKNLNGKSVTLDVYCRFSDGRYCNVEVQKQNDDDHQKRVRYNATALTSNIMPPGTKYKELEDVIVIYLSAFDMFKEEKTVYHIDRVIRETGTVVTNGFEELYINAAVDDKTEIAELMQYFKHSVGECPVAKKLSERVYAYKNNEAEVGAMCELMEKERQEGRAEGRAEGIMNAVLEMIKKDYGEELACSLLNVNYNEFREYVENNNINLEEIKGMDAPEPGRSR